MTDLLGMGSPRDVAAFQRFYRSRSITTIALTDTCCKLSERLFYQENSEESTTRSLGSQNSLRREIISLEPTTMARGLWLPKRVLVKIWIKLVPGGRFWLCKPSKPDFRGRFQPTMQADSRRAVGINAPGLDNWRNLIANLPGGKNGWVTWGTRWRDCE